MVRRLYSCSSSGMRDIPPRRNFACDFHILCNVNQRSTSSPWFPHLFHFKGFQELPVRKPYGERFHICEIRIEAGSRVEIVRVFVKVCTVFNALMIQLRVHVSMAGNDRPSIAPRPLGYFVQSPNFILDRIAGVNIALVRSMNYMQIQHATRFTFWRLCDEFTRKIKLLARGDSSPPGALHFASNVGTGG